MPEESQKSDLLIASSRTIDIFKDMALSPKTALKSLYWSIFSVAKHCGKYGDLEKMIPQLEDMHRMMVGNLRKIQGQEKQIVE